MTPQQWAYCVEQAELRGLDTRPSRSRCIWGLRSDGLMACLIHKDTRQPTPFEIPLQKGQARIEVFCR